MRDRSTTSKSYHIRTSGPVEMSAAGALTRPAAALLSGGAFE
jgi:hypothetical protein